MQKGDTLDVVICMDAVTCITLDHIKTRPESVNGSFTVACQKSTEEHDIGMYRRFWKSGCSGGVKPFIAGWLQLLLCKCGWRCQQ